MSEALTFAYVLVLACGEVPAEEVVGEPPQLALAILEGDVYARREALDRLEIMGPGAKRYSPLLLTCLHGEGWQHAAATLRALQAIEGNNLEMIPHLVEFLCRQHADEVARKWLHDMGPPALPKLIRLLETTDQPELDQLCRVLGEMGPAAADAAPALLRIARHDKGEYYPAKLALQRIGKAALPHCKVALHSKQLNLRRAAMSLLSHLGEDAEPLLPEILAGLEADDFWIGYSATAAVCNLGSKAAKAVPILSRQLRETADEDGFRSRRYDLIRALGCIGPKARTAVPALRPYLDDHATAHFMRPRLVVVNGQIVKKQRPIASILVSDYALWSLVEIDPSQRKAFSAAQQARYRLIEPLLRRKK